MSEKGVIILPLTLFFLLCTSALGITAHFVKQRKDGIIQLQKLQSELHQRHQNETSGKYRWSAQWNEAHKQFSKKKGILKHQIFVDFGDL